MLPVLVPGPLRTSGLFRGGLWCVIPFDDGPALEGAKNFIAPGNDFIPLLQAVEHLDLGSTGDSSGNGDEDDAQFFAIVAKDIDALYVLGLARGRSRAGSHARGSGSLAVVLLESLLGGRIALDQRLNGDSEGIRTMRGRDLGGGGEAGTQLFGGNFEGDDDLEVLGLFGSGGALAGGDAGGAEQGLVSNLGNFAFEDAAREGVDGDVGGLAEGDVDDVGLVDLDFRGDDGHIGEGHQGGAFGVLDAKDDGLAFADGNVGDEGVEGGAALGEAEGVVAAAQGGDGLVDVAVSGCGLSLGLGDGGLTLLQGRFGDVEGGFFGVVILLGDEFGLVEGPGAVEVEALLLEVGLGLDDVGFGGALCGGVGLDVGPGGGDGGVLRLDGGGGLFAFDRGDELAGLYAITFFDIEVGDAPEGGGSDVNIGFGLDLAGAIDDGDEILADGVAGGHLSDGALVVQDAADDDSCKDQDGNRDQDNFFEAHRAFSAFLRSTGVALWIWCSICRYATRTHLVPGFPGAFFVACRIEN